MLVSCTSTDDLGEHNLEDLKKKRSCRFFVRHAARGSQSSSTLVDFFVFVPEGAHKQDKRLPELPLGWNYVIVKGACDKYAALVTALTAPAIADKVYAKILLLDSLARGPFLPSYVRISWVDIFWGRLDKDVLSLVSPTMRCVAGTNARPAMYVNDPYALAMDYTGVTALQATLLQVPCEERSADAFVVPATMADLLLGWRFRVGSLQHKYHGAEWGRAGRRECAPTDLSEFQAAGLDTDPLEVVFVLHTAKLRSMGWDVADRTETVSRWMDQARAPGGPEIHSNRYMEHMEEFRSAVACWHRYIGPEQCFNRTHYLEQNPDLAAPLGGCPAGSPDACFRHYVISGAIEGRKASFSCQVHGSRLLSDYILRTTTPR